MKWPFLRGRGEQEFAASPKELSAPNIRYALVHSYGLPKAGNSSTDYEDSWLSSGNRFAVADGATESSFAKIWADALVRQFTALRPAVKDLLDWMIPIQKRWAEDVNSRQLAWFAAEKAQLGAFSTLLGLELHEDRTWWAVAVGDTCLFQIRQSTLLCAFPLSHASQFGTTPALLSSNPTKNRELASWVIEHSGDLESGDLFFLATDAVACWILKETEQGKNPWETLLSLDSESAFSRLIEEARLSGSMRNDDVTLLIVRVDEVTQPLVGCSAQS